MDKVDRSVCSFPQTHKQEKMLQFLQDGTCLLVPHVTLAVLDSVAQGCRLHVLAPEARAPDALLSSQERLMG